MRFNADSVLSAERQEPLTAAGHAAANGLEAEYARDVPRTCICVHQWSVQQRRYERVAVVDGCPWNTSPENRNAV